MWSYVFTFCAGAVAALFAIGYFVWFSIKPPKDNN